MSAPRPAPPVPPSSLAQPAQPTLARNQPFMSMNYRTAVMMAITFTGMHAFLQGLSGFFSARFREDTPPATDDNNAPKDDDLSLVLSPDILQIVSSFVMLAFMIVGVVAVRRNSVPLFRVFVGLSIAMALWLGGLAIFHFVQGETGLGINRALWAMIQSFFVTMYVRYYHLLAKDATAVAPMGATGPAFNGDSELAVRPQSTAFKG